MTGAFGAIASTFTLRAPEAAYIAGRIHILCSEL